MRELLFDQILFDFFIPLPSLLAFLTLSGVRSAAFIQGNTAKIIKANFILLVVSKKIDSHRITLTKVSKWFYMALF